MAGLIRRNKTYYALYYSGGKQKRVCLHTESLQIAREKVRQIESAQFKGEDNPLPTRTPIDKVLTAYVDHLRAVKREGSVQRDIYYLRETFGPICPAISVKNRKVSEKGKKRPARNPVPPIPANYFEQITTAEISQFIAAQVRTRALAPKTANHFRTILTRLYNWAMQMHGIRMPGNSNPAAKVERYREKAPEISFLTLEQIDQQLRALKDNLQLQTMVAVLIYAGLRREEVLWLTAKDVDFDSGPYGMLRIRAKTIDGKFWEPKTRVNRVVPISSTLRKYLDAWLVPHTKCGWFFPSPQGTRWDVDHFSQALAKANKEAKLAWSCLDYRHTFGSHLAVKGESLYKISKLMGNSPEICRRHYAALVPEMLVETVEF
ncbi:MAG: site-specific integrase [Deltaproteobacteria bacterium]|nr:MAG: site-specific integrase [Deltaproteobacteria bacterium]